MPAKSFSVRVIRDSAIMATVFATWAVFRCSSWTAAEIAREAAWEGLNTIDNRQSVQAARQPDHYRELNPILGEHPTEKALNLYFTAWVLLHPAITHALAREKTIFGIQTRPRALWQNISLSVSGGCVANNFGIGLNGE
jgi:hypothetical protein